MTTGDTHRGENMALGRVAVMLGTSMPTYHNIGNTIEGLKAVHTAAWCLHQHMHGPDSESASVDLEAFAATSRILWATLKATLDGVNPHLKEAFARTLPAHTAQLPPP